VRRIYGLTERQFRRYFERASRVKGITGELLISFLERRLDNVVYRLGFAGSRNEARVIVRYGHILINGRKLDIPSYQTKLGDVIEVKDRSQKLDRINKSLEILARRGLPDWLELEKENYKGIIKRLPQRIDVTFPIEEQLIVEFYSRV
jgi:small subunit ribosomal protein S4